MNLESRTDLELVFQISLIFLPVGCTRQVGEILFNLTQIIFNVMILMVRIKRFNVSCK